MKDEWQMSDREVAYWLKQFGVEVCASLPSPLVATANTVQYKRPKSTNLGRIAVNAVNRSDKETLAKLKKGKISIQAKLDLHGYGLQQAKEEFYSFIMSAAQVGARSLLVVTGKGNFSGGVGKIKASIGDWINDEHLKPLILTYCHAPLNMGGEGAVIVLLER